MGQVRQGEVDEKGRLLLRVYSNCVALKGMLSRVYSPQVPWSYLDGVSCAAPVCLPSAGTQRDGYIIGNVETSTPSHMVIRPSMVMFILLVELVDSDH